MIAQVDPRLPDACVSKVLQMAVTGSNFVRFTRSGLHSIRRTWPVLSDQFEIRRFALKLRFWDERHKHPPGVLFDHTYESIKALSGHGVYELRIDDVIGGQDNIRVVFFDPPNVWTPTAEHHRPLRTIWILEALQKKRNQWTTAQLQVFKSATVLLKQRCYLT